MLACFHHHIMQHPMTNCKLCALEVAVPSARV